MRDTSDSTGLAARPGLDLATVSGLSGGFLLIAVALIMGGSVRSFLDLPSILIVLGGTLSMTTVCYSLGEMARTVSVVGKAVFHSARDPGEAALRLIELSERARRGGVLALQDVLPALSAQPFLAKGLGMVVDGAPTEEVETVMARDIQAMVARHQKAAGVLRRAAEIAPAMGLIGTLIGLVQMLSHLDDPSTIGPSMAVALLTTFYGAILANMVFSPLAAKLDRNSGEEALVNQIHLLGAISISRQENPRRLEMLVNSILPPSQRVRYFSE